MEPRADLFYGICCLCLSAFVEVLLRLSKHESRIITCERSAYGLRTSV